MNVLKVLVGCGAFATVFSPLAAASAAAPRPAIEASPTEVPCYHSQHGSPGITSFTLYIDSLSPAGTCSMRSYVDTDFSGRAYGTIETSAPNSSKTNYYSSGCASYGYQVHAGTAPWNTIQMGTC